MTADKKKTTRKALPAAARGKGGRKPASAKTLVLEKPENETLQPEPVSPQAYAQVKPAGDRPNPVVLAVLGVIAVLVVVEVSFLLKGKADRQRSLSDVGTIGARGGDERPEAYHGALAMKIDAQDRLMLVDPDWAKVVIWDTKAGNFLMALDKVRAQRKDFAPTDAAADKQGQVFVLDRPHQEVTVFSPTGDFVRRWIAANASAIAVDPEGNVLVSDNLKMQVVRYSPEGKELKHMGGPGTARGRLNNPSRLAADAKGNIYVVDLGNKRIQVFSSQGSSGKAWSLKFVPNQLTGITPAGDEVYLNDFDNSFIWAYSPHGKILGQMSTTFPSNVAVDSTGNFYLPTANGIGRYVQIKGKAGK